MEHQAQYSDLLQLSKELDHIYHEVPLKMGLSDSGFSLLYALCERALIYDWCLSGGDYSLLQYGKTMMPRFFRDFRAEEENL